MAVTLRIDHDHDIENLYAQTFRSLLFFDGFYTKFPQETLFNAVNALADQASVNQILNTNPVDLISCAGHGTLGTLLGGDNSPIWDVSQSMALVAHKFIHLLACDCGQLLGPHMVHNQAVAFWGYQGRFEYKFLMRPASIADDWLAEVYFKMDIIIDDGILHRRSGDEIYQVICTYVLLAARKISDPIRRGVLLRNFVNIARPVKSWGDVYRTIP